MKPYDNSFILNVITEYSQIIKEQKNNNYSVSKQITVVDEGYMYKEKEEKKYEEIVLLKDTECVMKINVKEIQGSYMAIKSAYGKVGIVGLGLGYVVQEMAKNVKVESITVYENSNEIIQIYKKNFGDNPKIEIIEQDAFKAEPKKFDYFFSDIYGYELTDKVVDDYEAFMKLHEIEEYSFWGMEHFLLSCAYDDLLWIYVPENWVEISKKIYESLDLSGLMDKYYPLNSEFVHDILMKFKKILNE